MKEEVIVLEKKVDKNVKNKKNNLKIILISVLVFIVFLTSIALGYVASQMSKVKTTKISKSNEDLGITSQVAKEASKPDAPINIALFGVDRRERNENGNSDTIMIATIDKSRKKVKLTSIMRDSYVNVEGKGMVKINEAFAVGGPQLAIKTLNSNFNLDIRDFVAVDFYSLIKIIDALGGVTINVTKDELPIMNDMYIKDMSAALKVTPPYVKSPGVQLLNGMQAVGYSRIRYVGDGDYERTERQRVVLTQLLEKIQTGGVLKYPAVVNELLPDTETSLYLTDLVSLGSDLLNAGVKNIEQVRFPLKSFSHGETINNVWYLVIDKAATADQIHKYIYDDIKPPEDN